MSYFLHTVHVNDEIIKMLSVHINQYFNFFMFRINSVVYTCSLVLNFTSKYKVIIFQFLVKQSLSVCLTDQCDHTFDNPLASYLISDSHYDCKSCYERLGENLY